MSPSTRKVIMYRVKMLHRCLDRFVEILGDIEELSEGRPPRLRIHCETFRGVMLELHEAVNRLDLLYRGQPDAPLHAPPPPEVDGGG